MVAPVLLWAAIMTDFLRNAIVVAVSALIGATVPGRAWSGPNVCNGVH